MIRFAIGLRQPEAGYMLGMRHSVFINNSENEVSSLGLKTELNGNAIEYNFKL